METLPIHARGLRFDAVAAGPADGTLVLLLHGFPQTSWAWRHQLPALATAGYRAVAPDQRGYSPGARPTAVAAYRIPELVEDVVAFADALGAERFHIVGHDWGGAVAWQVAGRHADRVASVTVLSTPHPRPFAIALRHDREQRRRSAYFALMRSPVAERVLLAGHGFALRQLFARTGLTDVAPYLAALGTRAGLRGPVNYYRAADKSLLHGLGAVTAPALFVFGGRDPAFARATADATGAHVAGPYTYVVLEEHGHWLAEHAPDRINDLLLAHLAGAVC